jgi:SnoaL-like domain
VSTRAASLAMVAACALAGAGCGESDEEQVEDTVKAYMSAVADGDGEEACEQLTERGRREIAEGLTEVTGGEGCAGAFESLHARAGERALRRLRNAEVTSVTVDGDTATLRIEDAPHPPKLRKIDGEWKIDEFPAIEG